MAVEPFYSTNGIGKGTGLSLSVVHDLAVHHAAVSYHELGEGTIVEQWLPIGAGEADPASESNDPLPDAVTPLKIPRVDDQDLVRAATADMPLDVGDEAYEAHSRPSAI